MRPSSTRKSMPSSATVVPKALRRPRASMHAMASTLLLGWIRRGGFRWCRIRRWPAIFPSIQEFFGFQSKPLTGCRDPGPFFGQKLLPFAPQQQIARPGIDEHTKAAPALDQPLIHQFLIALENRERIDPILGRDVAHGRQRIAFLEHAIEYHRDHAVAKLAVNRLTVVPLTVHSGVQIAYLSWRAAALPLSSPREKTRVKKTSGGFCARSR